MGALAERPAGRGKARCGGVVKDTRGRLLPRVIRAVWKVRATVERVVITMNPESRGDAEC